MTFDLLTGNLPSLAVNVQAKQTAAVPLVPLTTVLVADDDDLFRDALQTALTRAGYRALTASNGSLALDTLRNEKVDVLVIDILMPEKDGLETLREFRRMKHDAAVITMSGGGRLEADFFTKSARYLGASATLLKPFTLEELLEALKNV